MPMQNNAILKISTFLCGGEGARANSLARYQGVTMLHYSWKRQTRALHRENCKNKLNLSHPHILPSLHHLDGG